MVLMIIVNPPRPHPFSSLSLVSEFPHVCGTSDHRTGLILIDYNRYRFSRHEYIMVRLEQLHTSWTVIALAVSGCLQTNYREMDFKHWGRGHCGTSQAYWRLVLLRWSNEVTWFFSIRWLAMFLSIEEQNDHMIYRDPVECIDYGALQAWLAKGYALLKLRSCWFVR